ncbi:MAG: SIR2 family protein [Pontixanthobacter sp.]
MLTVRQLVRDLRPEKTVLFFGAGSSVPSGLPSGEDLRQSMGNKFSITVDGYDLAEVAQLAELKDDRSALIKLLRKHIGNADPTGSLLNIPMYNWKSIFTTNYDNLIETSYRRRNRKLPRYHTDFDFSQDASPADTPLFKLHGTIEHDVADGHQSRIIITLNDYDKTEEYRNSIYDRFSSELAGSNLIVIGQKLSDRDIQDVIDRALSIQGKLQGAGGSISLLLYEKDEARAALFENRGIRVCFGGIDDFFAEISQKANQNATSIPATDPLDIVHRLRPITVDADHSRTAFKAKPIAMFNGRPATLSDIDQGLTFRRTITDKIAKLFSNDKQAVGIIGTPGVGKTTAIRQYLLRAIEDGWFCWEHKGDFRLLPDEWLKVANHLSTENEFGVLFVDDAHTQINEIGSLCELLESEKLTCLKIVYSSSKSNWSHRVKSPSLLNMTHELSLSQLNQNEVDRLIELIDSSDQIRPLVENSFIGFSRQQKRTRLIEKCEQDMFVCLKNIFATDNFDAIILKEYNDLDDGLQEIYKLVSAMEASGVRVHRQLVLRAIGLPANQISMALNRLEGIVDEYEVSQKLGIYGWRTRHSVIATIIAKYKFSDQADYEKLFEHVISSLSPTWEIERRTINELSSFDTGIRRLSDVAAQNRLLRQMISVAPGERVPRHRLIKNLIDQEQFDVAETEIKVFESDLGRDGPVARYRALLLMRRALNTPGLADSDRLVMLEDAFARAISSQERYSNNKTVFYIACEIGLHIIKFKNDFSSFDDALRRLKLAEARLEDPDISRQIRAFERRSTS